MSQIKIILSISLFLFPFGLSGCDISSPFIGQGYDSPKPTHTLQQFNDSVRLKLVSRRLITTDNPRTVFSFEIENLSDKPIKSVRWIAVYLVKGKIIFNTEQVATFSTYLAPQSRRTREFQYTLSKLPAVTNTIFSNAESQIYVLNIAREIRFNDDSVIQIRE